VNGSRFRRERRGPGPAPFCQPLDAPRAQEIWAGFLKSKRRLGTLLSAEDVPSLAELGRWSSPNRLNQSWQQCGPVGYSAPATLPNHRPLRDESNGTGILSTGLAQIAPFIKPSTLWTILACPRSYTHALTLDLVDDRSFDRVWSHAGIGRRWHLGLSPRLSWQPRGALKRITIDFARG
jgi:hypothetical protein